MKPSDFKKWPRISQNELADEFSRYLAKAIVGPSSLRSQGPEGTIAAIRNYMVNEFKLSDFSLSEQKKYLKTIDLHSKEMAKVFANIKYVGNKNPQPAKTNWGASRKIINIYLLHVTSNNLLLQKHKLTSLRQYLEVPLDNLMINFLIRQIDNKKSPHHITLKKWHSIYDLEKHLSDKIQKIASMIALDIGCNRCELDYLSWRDLEN